MKFQIPREKALEALILATVFSLLITNDLPKPAFKRSTHFKLNIRQNYYQKSRNPFHMPWHSITRNGETVIRPGKNTEEANTTQNKTTLKVTWRDTTYEPLIFYPF